MWIWGLEEGARFLLLTRRNTVTVHSRLELAFWLSSNLCIYLLCLIDAYWPLLAFPEMSQTNGQRGFLAFDQWPFSLDRPVQPVLLSLSRPSFAQISPVRAQ